jgi:UDP-N-acetylmuramoylalanine--D-glutamate ligase
VITNIFQDHLNRHGTIENYATVKANIFKNQKEDQFTIFNKENDWTKYFVDTKPKSKIQLFSTNNLSDDETGLDIEELGKHIDIVKFEKDFGHHNLENLLASALAARLAGCDWENIVKRIPTLPTVEFRQEIIFKNDRLVIVNDTTATSPEGAIAAIKRFGGDNCVLIAGGTNRELDFSNWAREVQNKLKPENIILLSGSATNEMLKFLNFKPEVCDTLQECFEKAIERSVGYGKAVILFSPGAKSFEKFLNEYDRGNKFNEMVKIHFGKN